MPTPLFQKGNKGKPKGAVNKLTKQMQTVKEMVLNTAIELNKNPKTSIKQFAKDDPKTFWTIASKLIPTELTATLKSEKTVYDLFPDELNAHFESNK